MLTKEEMQEALEELDATILIQGGEIRLSNVHVERLATFDFDFEGCTLVRRRQPDAWRKHEHEAPTR